MRTVGNEDIVVVKEQGESRIFFRRAVEHMIKFLVCDCWDKSLKFYHLEVVMCL